MMCRTYYSAAQTRGQGHTSRSCDLPFILCPLHIEQFSLNFIQMFLSARRCAEPITQLPRLKAKDTSQSQWINPWISYPLHISWALRSIFIKLHQNVPLSETIIRTYDCFADSRSMSHFQGHVIYPSVCVHAISSEPFEWFSKNFTHMFLSVRQYAEPLTQLCRLNIKVTLQGHGIYLRTSSTIC